MGPGSTSTQLVKSATSVSEGVTKDGNVIFYDTTTKNLSYVPVAGGTPATVGAWDNSSFVMSGPSYDVALYWNGASQTTPPAIGALSVWTKAGGNHVIASASFAGYVDVSPDSKYVLYIDHATTTSAEVYVAGADGSNPTQLVTGAAYSATATTTSCNPALKFIGDYAVVAWCPSGVTSDAGNLSATITAWNLVGSTWTAGTPFSTAGFNGFNGSDDGTQIEYVTAGGEYVSPIGGGTAKLIDANGGGGIFTHDGANLLYLDQTGVLWRSPIGTPVPVQVAAGPFAGFLTSQAGGFLGVLPGLSSDDSYLLMASVYGTSSTFLSDVYITSTAAGSTAKHLVTTALGALMGDAFTADNHYATFYQNVTLQGTSSYVGDYDDIALNPLASMPTDFAMLVWQNYSAATGSKTIYNDNYQAGSNNGRADIKVKDLSSNNPPTLIAQQADANIFITGDRGTIVYSWNVCAGGQTGVWATPVP